MVIDEDALVADPERGPHTRVTLAAVAESVPRARHLVRTWLDAWGLTALVGRLELAVAELVSNAVRHGTGPVEIAMTLRPGRVRVEVHDHGGRQPTLRPIQLGGSEMGGWGLRLVDQLVDVWGSHVRRERTIVWVEHPISSSQTGPAQRGRADE